MEGAVEMQFKSGTKYIILDVNEFRSGGPVFCVYDAAMRGSHLLSADDIRANWNAWVGDLVRRDRIVTEIPDGIGVY